MMVQMNIYTPPICHLSYHSRASHQVQDQPNVDAGRIQGDPGQLQRERLMDMITGTPGQLAEDYTVSFWCLVSRIQHSKQGQEGPPVIAEE